MAINTYFKNIANAIREKTGGTAFITPGQMPGEIRNITTGAAPIDPYYRNFKGYYISGSSFINDGNIQNNSFFYKPFPTVQKCAIITEDIVGNVLRVGSCDIDPSTLTGQTLTITPLLTINEGQVNTLTAYTITVPANKYIIVYKGYQNSELPNVFLYKTNDLVEV